MIEEATPEQKFINRLTDIVLSNLENEDFGVNDLAKASGLTLYSLSLRIHSVCGKTVNHFIRQVRLQKAMEMLQNKEFTASEVAYKTGFGSPAYFNKCFREYYGYSPGKVKNSNSALHKKLTADHKPNDRVSRKSVSERITSKWRIIALIVVISVTLSVLARREVSEAKTPGDLVSQDGRISLAVLPFHNMTNDTVMNVWQDGIQTCLITSLSNARELKVRQLETINGLLRSKGHTDYASITPSVAKSLSRDLDATVLIQGSISQADSIIRINAQLINSKTEEGLQSFHVDGVYGSFIHMIDSLSGLIRNSLIISELGRVGPPSYHEPYLKAVASPEAYRYFIYGQNALYNNDFPTAIDRFKQALAIDSTLLGAMGKISIAYYNEGNYGQAKEWCLKYYKKKDYLPLEQRIWAEFIYAGLFKTPNERNQYMDQLQDIDDQNPLTYFNKGDGHLEMDQFKEAISEFEKALEIFQKRKTKPFWVAFYNELGLAYHGAGMYREEKKLYKKALQDFPDDPQILDQYAGLALIMGDTVAANEYKAKYISIRKEQSWSEARIAGSIAYIYQMAKMPDKVEEYYRKSLMLEPENPVRINSLAFILIDNERSIEEGMALLETVLEANPSNYASLGLKGWGLYKLGRYQESLDLLQKSWDLRMERSVYNHAAYVRLEAAKKKVSES